MMTFTQKYTLVQFVEPLPDGSEYDMKDWPLHVTLADVFAIDSTPGDLLIDLRKKLEVVSPFASSVTGEASFGPRGETKVMLVEKTPELESLHYDVLEVLGAHGVVFNTPEYTAEGFRPHSTIQKAEQLSLGQRIEFANLTLIDMFPDADPYLRKVVGSVPIVVPSSER